MPVTPLCWASVKNISKERRAAGHAVQNVSSHNNMSLYNRE